jgi:hypothetical protein
VSREHGYTARQEAVRDELRAGDAGFALFGDPGAVAADLGVAGAQARVATVVAGLADDDRFRAAAPGWVGETSERVRTAATGDDPAPERVGRLQAVARDAVSDHADLGAVRRTDVTVAPPDGPRAAGAYVADRLGVEGEVAAAVDDLVDEGAVDPVQVAGLARLFGTTVSGRPPRESVDRTRAELDDRAPDDPALHPARRVAADLRRGARAVRSAVGLWSATDDPDPPDRATTPPGDAAPGGDERPSAPVPATDAGDAVAATAAAAAGPGPLDGRAREALATVVAAADPDPDALARRRPLPATDRSSLVDRVSGRAAAGEAPARGAGDRGVGGRDA